VAVDAAFWRGKKVLITGHSGFKGSWLSLWLHSMGAEVVGLSRGVPTHPSLFELARLSEEIESVEGDIRNAELVRATVAEHRPEVVLHMAAQPLVRRAYAEPGETYETNVMGTVNVLEAVRRAGDVRAVVNVTTDKCYENREWEWGYREDDPKGGADPYSSSKACSELVTDAYRRSYFSSAPGTALASARAGNVIGGGDWAEDRLVPDLMRAALERREVKIRNPEAIRPWQHVLNPLSGYLALAHAVWNGADEAVAFNFGPEERDNRPVWWVADKVVELWGGSLSWSREGLPQPPESHFLKLDSSRAHLRLGWRPPWDVREGLGRTVSWFRAYHDGEDMREVTLAQIRDQQASEADTLAAAT